MWKGLAIIPLPLAFSEDRLPLRSVKLQTCRTPGSVRGAARKGRPFRNAIFAGGAWALESQVFAVRRGLAQEGIPVPGLC